MALQSGRNFTYPEGYLDHSDAYKSALTLNDIIEEASPNEQSWILQDIISQLPFARTACETGFNAGHHAFHMLTANYDLVVHSFEVCPSTSSTSQSEYTFRRNRRQLKAWLFKQSFPYIII